jgi:hypothetical protein
MNKSKYRYYMNIIEDFRILRNQVPKETFTDSDLKTLFKENKFDIVNTLMVVEERINGNKDYRLLETIPEKSEHVKKIEELRIIADEKDAILRAMSASRNSI